METSAWELFLPEGLLDFFEVSSAEKTKEGYTVNLVEKHLQPGEFPGQRLTSKGFYGAVTVRDFPIRGRACYLKLKRRRWLDEDTGQLVSRDWELVAKGTRMTNDLATFLKGLH